MLEAFEAMCKILEDEIELYTLAEFLETMDGQNDDVYTAKMTIIKREIWGQCTVFTL